jgi:hypothetical protein
MQSNIAPLQMTPRFVIRLKIATIMNSLVAHTFATRGKSLTAADVH